MSIKWGSMMGKNENDTSGNSNKYGYQPKNSGDSGASGVRSGYQPVGSGGGPANQPPKKP